VKKIENGLYRGVTYAFCSGYLAIIEAMQMEALVVAVYTNELKKDYLSTHPQADNMVIAGNFVELAEKLKELSCERRKNMINESSSWAKAQTWGKLADTYLDLWQ
jgi:hypothetical protein